MSAQAAPDAKYRIERNDPDYVRMAREEAAFWSAEEEGFAEAVDARAGDTVFDRHTNLRFTGNERTTWVERLAERGPFKSGLVLGTSTIEQGARLLDAWPGLQLTFCDIAEGSLARWEAVLGQRFPGRVAVRVEDLNFAALPVETYDLVVSASTLHHIVNLEHLAGEINRALTHGGLFAMQDCVCESHFAYTEVKKRIFEAVYNRDVARQRGRSPGVIWTNEDTSGRSPFCGVRSGDILQVFSGAMQLEEVRTASAISGVMLHAQPADGARVGTSTRLRQRLAKRATRVLPWLRGRPQALPLSEAFVGELLLADDIATDCGLVVPMNAFAVFRKRTDH